MNILDLFAGIGGFSQGLIQSGFSFKKHLFAEIDKHAQAIYKHRFPNAQAVGDVRHVRGSELGKIDIITFGSPCQDFSLAGKRRGMDGERSSLVTEAIRLINECRPQFFIWENVKGTFSSNGGADFWAIIQAFADLGGYRLEWQLLNTAWFLPQNRERVYLVGRLADWCRGEIFPIRENDKLAGKTRGKKRGPIQTAKCLTVAAAKQNLETNYLKINSATSSGYETAKPGDSINFTFPKSETRRGRVGKGKAQTLDCASNQGTIEGDRIRRLTEVEHERLQGFPDSWTKWGNYDGEVKEVSATQRYKCLGNAVTVDVVEAVGRAILENAA